MVTIIVTVIADSGMSHWQGLKLLASSLIKNRVLANVRASPVLVFIIYEEENSAIKAKAGRHQNDPVTKVNVT